MTAVAQRAVRTGHAPSIRRRARGGPADVYAGPSRLHGLGVFAAREFRAGEVVERCPVIVVPEDAATALDETSLRTYLYEWDADYAVALGLGSLYNHARRPSARCEAHLDDNVLVVRANRRIHAGEEITISYCRDDELWFQPTE